MRYPKIIYYHDIATCVDDCPPRCYGPTIGQFREHVTYLQSRFNILDPLELVDCCKSGRFPRKPSVAITFDDGLSGVMLAAEVLAEAKLPALVFLATRFIDTREHPWFVHLDDLILEAAKRRKPLSISGREFSMNTISNRMPFRRRAKMLLLGRPYNEQVTALTEWADEIGWRLGEGREDEGTFLSWRQVEELAGSGFHFASHTHSHVDLRVLSDEELDKEFAEPIRLITEHIGAEHCRFLSYPDGRFDERVLSVARQRHEAAFAVMQLASWDDPYRLPRRCVGAGGTGLLKEILSWRTVCKERIKRRVKMMLGMYSDEM